MGELRTVALQDLVRDERLQFRAELQEERLRKYRDRYEEHGIEGMDPVEVVQAEQGLLLVNGFHRAVAAERAGLLDVLALVTPGTWRDAWMAALEANQKTSAELSVKDIRRKAETILRDEELAALSNRELDRRFGISRETFRLLRLELAASGAVATSATVKDSLGREQPRAKPEKAEGAQERADLRRRAQQLHAWGFASLEIEGRDRPVELVLADLDQPMPGATRASYRRAIEAREKSRDRAELKVRQRVLLARLEKLEEQGLKRMAFPADPTGTHHVAILKGDLRLEALSAERIDVIQAAIEAAEAIGAEAAQAAGLAAFQAWKGLTEDEPAPSPAGESGGPATIAAEEPVASGPPEGSDGAAFNRELHADEAPCVQTRPELLEALAELPDDALLTLPPEATALTKLIQRCRSVVHWRGLAKRHALTASEGFALLGAARDAARVAARATAKASPGASLRQRLERLRAEGVEHIPAEMGRPVQVAWLIELVKGHPSAEDLERVRLLLEAEAERERGRCELLAERITALLAFQPGARLSDNTMLRADLASSTRLRDLSDLEAEVQALVPAAPPAAPSPDPAAETMDELAADLERIEQCPHLDLVGTLPDIEMATIIGCEAATLTAWRERRGIPLVNEVSPAAPSDEDAMVGEALDEARVELKTLRAVVDAQVAVCIACGPTDRCDEDRCCVTCGRDLVVVATSHDADMIREHWADEERQAQLRALEMAQGPAEGEPCSACGQLTSRMEAQPGQSIAYRLCPSCAIIARDERIAELQALQPWPDEMLLARQASAVKTDDGWVLPVDADEGSIADAITACQSRAKINRAPADELAGQVRRSVYRMLVAAHAVKLPPERLQPFGEWGVGDGLGSFPPPTVTVVQLGELPPKGEHPGGLALCVFRGQLRSSHGNGSIRLTLPSGD